jgi:hypothetical protein
MAARPPPVKTATEARQGRTTGVVPLGAGDLPDARNHPHDRRVHRFVGQCVEVITAHTLAPGRWAPDRTRQA